MRGSDYIAATQIRGEDESNISQYLAFQDRVRVHQTDVVTWKVPECLVSAW
jgi:hypothetical protein